ncbi:hypothetical protein F5Y18DRAFT_408767 [Xylariaceae sp. FL1019]|nr:hypothetical protein F5Y18DRAFT_408767 [Xylariaceae sp. FL1019]
MAESRYWPDYLSAYETLVVTIKLPSKAIDILKQRQPKPLTSIPSFGKLPVELRCIIWRFAVRAQNRVVELEVHHSRVYPFKAEVRIVNAPLPPLLVVNREAYHEVKPSYIESGTCLYPAGQTQPAQTQQGLRLCIEHDVFHLKDDYECVARSLFVDAAYGRATDAASDRPTWESLRNNPRFYESEQKIAAQFLRNQLMY